MRWSKPQLNSINVKCRIKANVKNTLYAYLNKGITLKPRLFSYIVDPKLVHLHL